MSTLTIEKLWKKKGFQPNERQRDAILHSDGPLFLTAGPGSGKTLVLLWRTVNIMVIHGVKAEEIFLSTFTEKAALQLREGLRTLLGIATNETGIPYDLSKMAIGTVHSICQKILVDRRFSTGATRPKSPNLMDELDQYFFLYQRRQWETMLTAAGFDDLNTANVEINQFIAESKSSSRHTAVSNCIALFNRFSEECLDPVEIRKRIRDVDKRKFLAAYSHYLQSLTELGKFGAVDFSLLQQKALEVLERSDRSESAFRHLIIDEYQDTNTVQERIFFKLAKGSNNICIVGDDDQALYRFRGATVENLVEFPTRCQHHLECKPTRIDLDTNYRSRQHIVHHYTDFINRCDWKKEHGRGHYRVHDKKIKPNSSDTSPCVIASTPADPETVYNEIADLVAKLIKTKKVEDPNQIAFLFPAMKGNTRVKCFKKALEQRDLKVYAPRAGRFLDQEEAVVLFGLFLEILGKPSISDEYSQGLREYTGWMSACAERAKEVIDRDRYLREFISDKREEIDGIIADYDLILRFVKRQKWSLKDPVTLEMRRKIAEIAGISERAKKTLRNQYLEKIIVQRSAEGKPFTLNYIVNRTTSLDWSVLDLFYQLNGFKYFRDLYDLAIEGDEGPMCNLGILTQYLARFMDHYAPIITADFLMEEKFVRTFFISYIYALYRRQESEYEDADDPFPKGRIPFLTIHQAKGLEFPVVVLGTPFKRDTGASRIEILTRELLQKTDGEPEDRIGEFDTMRMFYVALSRPKNLLVIPHFKGQGQQISEPFKTMLNEPGVLRIPRFDPKTLPNSAIEKDDLGKNYSYTSDYLVYNKCARHYMVFRKFGFVPSRSQTMFFGSLVHQTIEDLHHLLIENRK